MKKVLSIILLIFLMLSASAQSDFLENQKKYKRVITALQDKNKVILDKLKAKHIKLKELNILLIAYK